MSSDSVLIAVPILVVSFIILAIVFIYVRPRKKKLAWLLIILLGIPTVILAIYFVYLLYLSSTYYLDGYTITGRRVDNMAVETRNPELCEKIKLSPHGYVGGTGPNPDKVLRGICYTNVAVALRDAEICNFLAKETYGGKAGSAYKGCVTSVLYLLR